MSRHEINAKFKQIVEFADIGGFIDAPMFTYSEGMKLRLGFSVAVHAEPDILLLDEGMAVGDEEFRRKSMMTTNLLFQKNKTIVISSHWLEYLYKQTKKIIELINKHKKSKGKELLDVACGTGTHISLLKKKFNCTGVDLNEDMLRVARKKVRGVVFRKADMASFSLNKKFDVITCLFSAIGHLKTDRQIERAIESFSRHLKQGGVLVIEPWITKETRI